MFKKTKVLLSCSIILSNYSPTLVLAGSGNEDEEIPAASYEDTVLYKVDTTESNMLSISDDADVVFEEGFEGDSIEEGNSVESEVEDAENHENDESKSEADTLFVDLQSSDYILTKDESIYLYAQLTDFESVEMISLLFISENDDLTIKLDRDEVSSKFIYELTWLEDFVEGNYYLETVEVSGEGLENYDIIFDEFSLEIADYKLIQDAEDEGSNNETMENNYSDQNKDVKVNESASDGTEESNNDFEVDKHMEDSYELDASDGESEEIASSDTEDDYENEEIFNIELTSESIQINSNELFRGDNLVVDLNLTSDKSYNVDMKFANNSEVFHIQFFSGDSEYFRTKFIGDDINNGEWKLEEITFQYHEFNNNVLHEKIFYNEEVTSGPNAIDLSHIDFTVSGTLSLPPFWGTGELEILDMQKSFLSVGGIQTLTAQRNFINEISSIKLELMNDDTNAPLMYYVDADFEVDGSNITMQFEFTEDMVGERWSINSADITLEYLPSYDYGEGQFRTFYFHFSNADNYVFVSDSIPFIDVPESIKIDKGADFDIYDHFQVLDFIDGDITRQAEIEIDTIDTSQRSYNEGMIRSTNSLGKTSERRFYVRVMDPEITGVNINYHETALVLNRGDSVSLDSFEVYLETVDFDEPIEANPRWIPQNNSIINVKDDNTLVAVEPGLTYLFVESHGQIDAILVQVTLDNLKPFERIDGSRLLINRTINNDIYISRNSEVTFENVTVNGNIYLDGNLSLKNSYINGYVYSDNYKFYDDDYGVYPWSSYLSLDETSSVTDILPFDRDTFYLSIPQNHFFTINNMLYFGGYSADSITDPFNRWSTLNGLFFRQEYLNPYYHTDLEFNEKEFPIYNYSWNADTSSVNGIPKIEAVGELAITSFYKGDYKEFFKASDAEDGDITDKITVDDSLVNYDIEGGYDVTVTVENYAGYKVEEVFRFYLYKVEVYDIARERGWSYESIKAEDSELFKTTVTFLNTPHSMKFRIQGSNLSRLQSIDELIEWQVEDEEIVSIENTIFNNRDYFDANFYINLIGLKEGKTTISTEVDGTIYAFEVQVKDSRVLDFELEYDDLEIFVGDEKYIDIKEITLQHSPGYIIFTSSSDEEIVSVENRRLKAHKVGEVVISVKIEDIEKTINVKVNPLLEYQTHVQSYGWQSTVQNGQMSGTSGEAKRLEGIIFNLDQGGLDGNIEYRTHVQSYGWMDWVSNGEMSGTEGEAKRLEAIQIQLTEELAEMYDIYYRVHAQSFGWLDWAKNGEEAGTAGLAKRLEAIEVQLVAKGEAAPGPVSRAYVDASTFAPTVRYQTHVQSYGWQNPVVNGK